MKPAEYSAFDHNWRLWASIIIVGVLLFSVALGASFWSWKEPCPASFDTCAATKSMSIPVWRGAGPVSWRDLSPVRPARGPQDATGGLEVPRQRPIGC
jgi:hypothetical protein